MKKIVLILAVLFVVLTATAQDPYGKNGHKYISNDTATYTGTWYCFQAITQCIVDSIYMINQTGQYTFKGEYMIDDTIPAGTFLFGDFREVQLMSGKAFLYRKQD